jgi:hypothetical protein
MSLQAKLDAFKADLEAGKPPYSVPRSVIETMHRATAELISGRVNEAHRDLYALKARPSAFINIEGAPTRKYNERCGRPASLANRPCREPSTQAARLPPPRSGAYRPAG